MSLRVYVFFWLLIFIVLGYEYYALNFYPDIGISNHLGYELSPLPGRPLSLVLGWVGIGVMLLMNLYILKKRMPPFHNLPGSLPSWLNFHIFCGLVGPTFILFHCNFKVRGLVAISFWSMLISATSGIVGRYFYVQLLGKRQETENEVKKWSDKLVAFQKQAEMAIDDNGMNRLKSKALQYVGVSPRSIQSDGSIRWNAAQVLFASVVGDVRLLIDLPRTAKGFHWTSRLALKEYALAQRRLLFLEPFRNLMGYWHAFHTPFAVFMYLAAAIHIAAALLFGVSK